MSHFTQMAGLTTHNFLDTAVAAALAVGLTRALARGESETIGNFWVDMTRATLYVLLPISVLVALAFVALGIPQTLQGSFEVTTLEGARQSIAIGPVASQEAIKLIGTNGGGFFNANSAHPFENPNAWSNLIECWSQLVLPVAFVFTFGRMVGDPRQGRSLLAAMAFIFLVSLATLYRAEAIGNPLLTAIGVDPSGGNLEGKELRFSQASAALFAAATTGTGTGAANATFDSLTPLGGLVPLFNLLMGCVAPGGVGTGLYGILLLAILAVFLAGLMVGRTPEYLGKKIEAREIKLAMLSLLLTPSLVLGFAAISVGLKIALDSLGNAGPHGLSEILYAYACRQRFGIRWTRGEHALVQHHDRDCHAFRAHRRCRAHNGHSRVAGQEEKDRSVGRHVSNPWATFRHTASRRCADRDVATVLSNDHARPLARECAHGERSDVLIESKTSASVREATGTISEAGGPS
jgi:K+-transporting ATPase ATPase A chain